MTKAKRVPWIGYLPDSCQLCGHSFGDTMYDAAIGQGGPWGNVCRMCFVQNSCSLGTGKGQEYRLQPDGKWLKSAG